MEILNDSSIVRSTFIKVEDGCRPYRIVLRHVEGSFTPYVVHHESLRFEQSNIWVHEAFFWGHYFQNQPDAIDKFNEACREHGF